MGIQIYRGLRRPWLLLHTKLRLDPGGYCMMYIVYHRDQSSLTTMFSLHRQKHCAVPDVMSLPLQFNYQGHLMLLFYEQKCGLSVLGACKTCDCEVGLAPRRTCLWHHEYICGTMIYLWHHDIPVAPRTRTCSTMNPHFTCHPTLDLFF